MLLFFDLLSRSVPGGLARRRAPEPIFYVAFVRTVFLVFISIYRHHFAACPALKCGVGFPVNLIQVSVPPCLSALVAAKGFSFMSLSLMNISPTVFTYLIRPGVDRSVLNSINGISPEMRFYGVDADTQSFSDCSITCSFTPKCIGRIFLFLCHGFRSFQSNVIDRMIYVAACLIMLFIVPRAFDCRPYLGV